MLKTCSARMANVVRMKLGTEESEILALASLTALDGRSGTAC